jgi:hypothetical protein
MIAATFSTWIKKSRASERERERRDLCEEEIKEERQVQSNMAVVFVDGKFFSHEWEAKQG